MFKKFAALALLLTPVAAQAQWREATSEHFTVYSKTSSEELTKFATILERYDALLRLLSGTPPRVPGPSGHVTVFRLDDIAAVRTMYSSRSGIQNSVAGFYIPRAGGSVAFVPVNSDTEAGELSAQQVLLHEYAHHFMWMNFPAAYPGWFTEGFAEFHGVTTFADDGTATVGNSLNARKFSLGRNSVPLERMLTDEKPITGIDVFEMYARAWAAVHYFTFAENRRGQLDKYLTAVTQGVPRAKAAADAFGDMKKLTREFITYSGNRTFGGLKIGPSALKVGAVRVRELSPAENAMILLRAESTRGVNRQQALALVPRARRAAAPYANDPFVQTAMAEIEYDAGNFNEAEAAADRALAADLKQQRAMLYKGLVAVDRAKKAKTADGWKAARALLLAANKLDARNPEPMIEYYDTFAAAEEAPSKGAVTGLNAAFGLAPHDRDLRAKVARQYLRDGKVTEAKAVLAPLALGSHGARAIYGPVLEAMDKGDAAAALAAWDKLDADVKAALKKAEDGKDGE